MAFKMAWSKEELTGAPPVPAGMYTVMFKGFRPKTSKDGNSVNFNAEFEIISPEEYKGRRVFHSLNTGAGFIFTCFVHAAGLQMEEVQNENAGTEKADLTIPGVLEGSDDPNKKPEDWKYQGPLTNKTMQVELAETEYQGKKRNEVRQFICAVPGCTEKHSTNLIK